MNKKILKRYSLGVVSLMCLLMGCSQEQPANTPPPPAGRPVEVRLLVNAPLGAAAPNEGNINRLRLVVFGSAGASDQGELIVNKYYSTLPADKSLKEIITSGRRDVYLIVNEPLTGGGGELDDYKNIATVADVRRLTLAYQGTSSVGVYVPGEIPMCAERLNQQIRPEATNVIDGTVERTLAKVTLNLNIKNANFATGKQVVIDHITIKNLPASSYLIAQNYTGALVTSEKQAVGAVTTTSGYNFSSTNTFYVPEYLFDDLNKGAYIEIIGHVNGEPGKAAKYNIKLGDAMDDAKRYGDKYHITRNRHYTFTGDVKSYGEQDGVAVKVTVLPWNTVNMDEEVGRYVAFGKVTNAAGTAIGEGSNLADMGETLNVECSTNTGGWYTVTRDAKGVLVHQSAATASVSAVTSQSVSITIPKIGELTYLQSYTVSIYHRTIAQESLGPVKVLEFTQNGGLIPREALKNAGWTEATLPAHGLQIAKRGKGILPGGSAGASDERLAWKPTGTSTSGTSTAFGTGEQNTAAMAGVEHPAAQYCRDMGAGWFLPSKDELKLIYNSRAKLGTSYTFDAVFVYYWSSSEGDFTPWSWRVNFNTGELSNSDKGEDNKARCVKAI